MVKFQRSYQLDITNQPEDETSTQIAALAVDEDPLRVSIRPPLTTEFTIVRDIMAEANHAVFRITGLGESKRSRLYKDAFDAGIYRGVEFRAGYGSGGIAVPSDNLALCYKGNVKSGTSGREGTRMVTTLECQDGGFAFATGHISKGFSYGVKNLQLLQELVVGLNSKSKTIKFGPGIAPDGDISRLAQDTLPTDSATGGRGQAISGNAKELLQARSGGGFFVDNEVAHLLADEEVFEGPLTKISSAMGLLNTPKRQDGFLNLDMLFEPRLLIGQIVQLESSTQPNYNGYYKVLGLKHTGVISEAQSGTAITSVKLWFGNKALRVLKSGRTSAVDVLS